MSWLHCVVSRKKSLMSLIMNSRLETERGCMIGSKIPRQNQPFTKRSDPSCAFVYPCE